MRDILYRTTEEQFLLQNEAEGLTGVKDTDRAYHEIEKKHQLVQTTPGEFPPEHGIAKQEMHDEATGKKLVCETDMCTCALSILIITTIYILYTHSQSVLSLIPPSLQAH